MTITLSFPDGRSVPVLGQGTWNMGDERGRRDEEIATLRAGLDLGLRVVDTAEMYGGGRSERLVGEAIAGRRDEVFLVDKVLPSNASRRGTIEACERSLAALATDRIDLYLLHWPGSHPLSDTIEAFEELVERGLVRSWGVSNFDVDELDAIPRDAALQTDQVLYNPSRRGPEFDLFPALKARGVPVMAYSPIEQGRLLGDAALAGVAARHDATVAQIALAWTIRSGDVLAIPKASSVAHVEANAAALDIRLDADDLAAIDRAFPPPRRAQPLEVI